MGIQNVTKDLADSLGLGKAAGAAVSNVEEGSPAAKAGLEVGDVILKIDGRPVDGSADLSRTIRALKPGTKVNLSVWHGGKARDLVVTVAEFKDDETTKKEASSAKSKKAENKPGKLGVAASSPPSRKKALKVTGGVRSSRRRRGAGGRCRPRGRDPAREQRGHRQREGLQRGDPRSSTPRARGAPHPRRAERGSSPSARRLSNRQPSSSPRRRDPAKARTRSRLIPPRGNDRWREWRLWS